MDRHNPLKHTFSQSITYCRLLYPRLYPEPQTAIP